MTEAIPVMNEIYAGQVLTLDLSNSPENIKFDAEIHATALSSVLTIRGKIVKGFGRGGRQLGCPTANLELTSELTGAKEGVYFGFATLNNDHTVYKTVLSIGTNPHFQTTQATIECYLMHKFESDFYGSILSLVIVGYIRPQYAFNGIELLIKWIERDVRIASRALDEDQFSQYKNLPYLKGNPSSNA